MKTSRQRFLEYIRDHRAVTVAEISRALNMTPANARHHLSVLQDQNLVEAVGLRARRGKGRPAQVYSLSRPAQGDNLEKLAAALLRHFLQPLPVEDRRRAVEAIAGLIEEDFGARPDPPGGGLTQRLVFAVQRLNEMRYQARWEAHSQGPHIILSHCPYGELVHGYAEICSLDQALLQRLSGTSVRQAARLELDERGLSYCRFIVGEREPKP